MRFKIFGEIELHAHSWILKEHSQFFLKFLDPVNKGVSRYPITSPEKNLTGAETAPASLAAPATTEFKYEWVSLVDDDGKDWHVVSASSTEVSNVSARIQKKGTLTKDVKEGDKHVATLPTDLQYCLFRQFLGTFYHQIPFFEDTEDLNGLTAMADYYCALKIVSIMITAAISTNAYLMDLPLDHAVELINSAAKLRNEVLFKDCVVLACGPYPTPQFKTTTTLNPKVRDVVEKAFGQLRSWIAEVEYELATSVTPGPADNGKSGDYVARKKHMRKFIEDMKEKSMIDAYDGSGDYVFNMPGFYQGLSNSKYGPPWKPPGEPFFRTGRVITLLRNDMVLNRQATAVKDNFEHYFLCNLIDDEDLPWDSGDTLSGW